MSLTPGTITLVSKSSTDIDLSATDATGGTQPVAFRQWYRNTTGSAPVGGDAITGATGLTLNDTGLTPGTTYFYFLNYRDSAGTPATAQATFTQATDAAPPLTAGTITLVSSTSTTVNLSSSEATGGVQPIANRQWYRNTTGAPAVAGDILTGQTGLTLADTGLTPGTTYYYTLNFFDSASNGVGATFSTTTPAAIPHSLTASPSLVGISTSGTLTFTDPGARWTSSAPTFSPTALAGFSMGAVTVVDDKTSTAPYTAGATAGTVTFAESGASATLAVTSDPIYLTAVPAGLFAAGLTSTSYRVSLNDGPYGAPVTAGITEDIPGAYSAVFSEPAGSTVKVKWSDGGTTPAVDYSPQVVARGGIVLADLRAELDARALTSATTSHTNAIVVTDGRVSSSFDAIGNIPIRPGIYTMRAASTANLVHFSADDAVANGSSGTVNRYLEILGGAGIGARRIGVATVSGVTGLKDGIPTDDASGFDTSTTYRWGDVIPDGVNLAGVQAELDARNATAANLGHLDAAVSSRLAPTTPGASLAVSTTGHAGIDLSNIKQAAAPTTLANLTIPRVTLADTVTNAPTGSGASLASIQAELDARNATAANLAHLDAPVSSRLAPSVAGHTLGVSASGFAAIDFAAVNLPASPTTLTNLIIPHVNLVDTATNATGSGGASLSDITTAMNSALASGITKLGPDGVDLVMVEDNLSLKDSAKVGLTADINRIVGNGTAVVTAGGVPLPVPTRVGQTTIVVAMGGSGLVDRTAVTTLNLSPA